MTKDRPKKRFPVGAISAVIIVMAVLGLVSFSNLKKGEKGPMIQVMPTSYNFGDLSYPYEAVKKEFLVRNIGDRPLQILGLSTSCGCTKATIEAERLLPGQATTLQVTYDPNLMAQSEPEDGEIFRIVYIKSNDPKQPEVEIEIRARLMKGD